MKYYIFLIIFVLLGYSSLNGQRLTSTQISKNFSNLKVPENKSIIVFESDLDLSFTSSMEKLEPPVKKENIYFLTVSERICIIKVTNNVSKSDVELPFGQLSDKTLPIIKKGEYLVFKIEENQKELIVLNQTEVKKGEGLNDNQMLYDKEALLILNVDPFDLEIELESTHPITAIKHSGKQYKVYIKPVKQVIIVKQKGSDVQGVINIIQIEPKEVQYYYVSLPEQLRKREVIYDKSISVGDYLIESVPSGAVIEIFGNPSFNAEKNKTPYLLKGFETGFKVVTLTLQEYETIKDTIQIGSSKKNKSNYNLVPQFAFINIKVDPQFPYSSLYVDNQLYYAQNETDIKIPVSSKEVEIRAPHFESEKIEISPTPGEVISITKTMKPIMGKLYLVCGENAENGKVYITNSQLNIEKKLIGILPINDTLILQEGQYDLIVEKEGYALFKKTIQIEKNKVSNEEISLGLTKKVLIITDPDNAAIYIDGSYIGKSNKRFNFAIGSHEIIVIKEGYENHYEKINIFSFVDSIRIELKINQILLTLSYQNKTEGNPPLPMPQKTPIFSINNSFFTKMNINSKGSIVYSPNYIAITPNIEQKITIYRRDYHSTKDDMFYIFPSNFTKMNGLFISNAIISYNLKKINTGLKVENKFLNTSDTTSNKMGHNNMTLIINNFTENSLSFYSNKKIISYYKEEEKYILFLKRKKQKLTIVENNTPYSGVYLVTPVKDQKQQIEQNIYRDIQISNKTVFADEQIQKYKNNSNKDSCRLLIVNIKNNKCGIFIEGLDNSYNHYLIIDKMYFKLITIPKGKYKYTVDGLDMGDFHLNKEFTINNEKIFRYYSLFHNWHGSNKYKGYAIANLSISTFDAEMDFEEISNNNLFEFSRWSGYLYYKDQQVKCEIIINNNNTDLILNTNSYIDSILKNCKMQCSYDVESKTINFAPINSLVKLNNFSIEGTLKNDTLFEGKVKNPLFGKVFLKRDSVFYSNFYNTIKVKSNKKIYAKISNVDDVAAIYINGKRVIFSEWGDVHPAYSGNSGWIDITDFFSLGNNKVRLYLWNKQGCCNTSANFQIRSNGQIILNEDFNKQSSNEGVQYDETIDLFINE